MTSVQKLSGIFQNMYTSVEQLDNRVHTGNPVSDAVINSKFQYAKKTIHGIRLAADELIVPDTISVEAYDIGIILSNGLDNAIEACQKLDGQNRRRIPIFRSALFGKEKCILSRLKTVLMG